MTDFSLESLWSRKPMQEVSLWEDGAFVPISCTALPFGREVRFTVTFPFRTYRVTLELYSDDTGITTRYDLFAAGENSFALTLPTSSLCDEHGGLFYYAYHLTGEKGEMDLRFSYPDAEEYLCHARGDKDDFFQLLIYKKRETEPGWFLGGVMYHVFVDRFFSAGHNPKRDDAVLNPDWENGMPELPAYPGAPMKNNTFFGGDLQGVTEKLDYIASLGVNCLYLSPIFEAYSNHKYDTGDYTKIDAMFGGEKAFDALVSEAKKRGITLMLDGVFNHTGDDSVYFNAKGRYPSVGAAQSEDSPYRSWYSFRHFPDEYECWWNIRILPRVNGEAPAWRHFLFGENGVIRQYIRKGIGAWRLDVADELSDDFLSELKRAALAERKDAMILGEVWEDASDKIAYSTRKKYLRGEELDSIMNYPMKEAVIAWVRDGNAEKFQSEAGRIYTHYPKETQDRLMNLLGTHDTARILTVLSEKNPPLMNAPELAGRRLSPEAEKAAKKKLRLAYLITCMLPGVPCIYYGDEAGMQGYSDPLNRMPYPWGREDASLLSYYQKLGAIRRSHDVFVDGSFRLLYADPSLLCLGREKGGTRLTAFINRGISSYSLTLSKSSSELLSDRKGCVFALPSDSALLFETDQNTDIRVCSVASVSEETDSLSSDRGEI